jgi:hypothetical protein
MPASRAQSFCNRQTDPPFIFFSREENMKLTKQ